MHDMSHTQSLETAPRSRHPGLWLLCLFLLALGLTLHGLASHVPPAHWAKALFAPNPSDIREMVIHYSWFPRVVLSLLCGSALALAGVVLQQVLRNPLAEPMTVGISAGSYLALLLATLWAPVGLLAWREGIALTGGALAMVFVFALAWRRALSPVTVVLGGMIVNLACGAISLALTIIYERSLTAMFIWGGGALAQQDWHTTLWLLPRVAMCAVVCIYLIRPLTLLGLNDEGARSLGLSLTSARFIALAIAVLLSGFVVAAVGVIGFIGLAAPALVRALGATRVRDQLIWSAVAGALLLWLTDQGLQHLPGLFGELLPTGAATALLGGPLLLWMLPRMQSRAAPPHEASLGEAARAASKPMRAWPRMVGGVVALLFVIVVAASWGRGVDGWHWASGVQLSDLWQWRGPRIISALAVGSMLALAGTLLQRLTGNPMASPEVMGISGGGMLGIIVLIFAVHAPEQWMLFGACAIGAFVTLMAMLAFSRRGDFATERLLLAGIAIGALAQSVIGLVIAGSGPYASMLRNLFMGSTYLISGSLASVALGVALLLLAIALLCVRWLTIFPLGAGLAATLGVNVRRARLAILVIAGLLSAASAMIIGPMSFIGLMAPHIVRRLGVRRAAPEIVASALMGSGLMVLSDWLGRNVLFPEQMPAGLLAMIVGSAYLMWSFRR